MLVTSILSSLLLVGSASAQLATKSYVTCVTKQGPKSTSPVRTNSAVITVPWYALRITTATPSKTVTPLTSTTTISSTTTLLSTITLPQETDTLILTETVTSSTLSTVTVLSTSTSTISSIVTSTDTTTVPTTAGFIAIETSIPNSQKRRSVNENTIVERATQQKLSVVNGKAVCDPVIYPQSVLCGGIVAVVSTITRTKTASKTQTFFAPTPLATVTSTFTTSSTITITPVRASTTLTTTTTVSTLSQVMTTSTQTTTVTDVATVAAPQATFYAACADNNLINTVNGMGITAVGPRPGYAFTSTFSTGSAYNCCAQCVAMGSCTGSAWVQSISTCFLLGAADGASCSQANVVFNIGVTPGPGAITVSNGLCGVGQLSAV